MRQSSELVRKDLAHCKSRGIYIKDGLCWNGLRVSPGYRTISKVMCTKCLAQHEGSFLSWWRCSGQLHWRCRHRSLLHPFAHSFRYTRSQQVTSASMNETVFFCFHCGAKGQKVRTLPMDLSPSLQYVYFWYGMKWWWSFLSGPDTDWRFCAHFSLC